VLARYADSPLHGLPALTRNGTAWYLGTRLVDADLRELLAKVCAAAGVSAPVPRPPAGLEVVRRIRPDGSRLLFLINHAGADAPVELRGTDLLTGAANPTVVPAGGVVVLHEAN
jgi:beta-galactosidase